MSENRFLHSCKRDLIDKAEKLRRKHCEGPPYDPFLIARAMGVEVKEEVLHGIDGYTDYTGSTIRAVLHSGAPATRRRFTLAHELGHVILYWTAQAGIPMGLRSYRSTAKFGSAHQDPNEETLCNQFAAAFLMPLAEIRESVKGGRVNPDGILRTADRFNVSVHACATRIVEAVGRDRLGISYWNASDKDWPALVWSAGFSTRVTSAVKKVKESVTEVSKTRVEHVTFWQSYRPPSKGEKLGFSINAAPVRGDYCIAILTRKAFPNKVQWVGPTCQATDALQMQLPFVPDTYKSR